MSLKGVPIKIDDMQLFVLCDMSLKGVPIKIKIEIATVPLVQLEKTPIYGAIAFVLIAIAEIRLIYNTYPMLRPINKQNAATV